MEGRHAHPSGITGSMWLPQFRQDQAVLMSTVWRARSEMGILNTGC